jgi:hypothetical protein
MDPLSGEKKEIYFKKKNTTLLVYLAFMLSFLWFSVGMWLLAYTFPVQTNPWQTSLRILGNHLGLWYPIIIYYFFELLKKVQLKTRDSMSQEPAIVKPPLLLVDLKNKNVDRILDATILLKSSRSNPDDEIMKAV